MYFDSFPVIIYDSVGQGTYKDVTNLLRRVSMRSKVKSNALMFDTYDVKEGETPEMIADKLYGDSELHWIILLLNDITDRYHQWPMTTPQFLAFINDKYDNVDDVHHYEIAQSSGNTDTKIEVYQNSALYTGDSDFYASASTVTNFEYEESVQDEVRKIRLLDPLYIDQFVTEFETLMKESII
tara:strand:+ start:648 stop:1196 length:549 start_codon:yes stop_codon:yes gene_type:complete